MTLPPPIRAKLPCSNCGYDLRATTGGVCPECGTRVQQRRSLGLSSSESDPTNSVIEALIQVRKGVCWSLLLWLGCVAVPVIGQLAWVALAIASGLRSVAHWRLVQTKYLSMFAQEPMLASWSRFAIAELAVAVCGGILTIVTSTRTNPMAILLILCILRIAWMGLVCVNNYSAVALGMATIRKFSPDPLPSHFRLAPIALFAAPILFLPFLITVAFAGPTQPPEWVATINVSFLVLGCLIGITSVIMAFSLLDLTADALHESRRPTEPGSPGDQTPRIRTPEHRAPKQPRIPDAPPSAGEGEVIPFAKEPPDRTA